MLRNLLILLGLGTLLLAQPLSAQEAEESHAATSHATHPILERLSKLGDKPFQCTINLNVTAEEGKSGTGVANLAYGSSRQFALDLRLTPQDAEGDAQKMHLKIVGDGDYLNIEAAQGEADAQGFKISFEALNQLLDAGAGPMGGMMPVAGNPVEAIQTVLSAIDFTENSAGGVTTFSAKVTPESMPEELRGNMEESFDVALAFDNGNGFPRSIDVSTEEVMVKLASSDVSFPESLPDSTFAYTAPEGMFVMDLTGQVQMMIEMQKNQGQEEEF